MLIVLTYKRTQGNAQTHPYGSENRSSVRRNTVRRPKEVEEVAEEEAEVVLVATNENTRADTNEDNPLEAAALV